MAAEYYAWFSRPNDTVPEQPAIDPVRFGPFSEFLQLTYNELRVGPNGDSFAYYAEGGWRVISDRSNDDPGYWYSDVVITEQAS